MSDLDNTVKGMEKITQSANDFGRSWEGALRTVTGLNQGLALAGGIIDSTLGATIGQMREIESLVRDAADAAGDFSQQMGEGFERQRLQGAGMRFGNIDAEMANLEARQAAALASMAEDWADFGLTIKGVFVDVIEAIATPARSLNELQMNLNDATDNLDKIVERNANSWIKSGHLQVIAT
jgi:hypothetical protein